MNKRSAIEAVFIYAISSIVIVLILYFGYKGITGIGNARQESMLEQAKLQIRADFSQIALRYDTTANFHYQLPSKFNKLCFADLLASEENKTLRDPELLNYQLIKDSVESNLPSNVFFVGETTDAFDAGKLRLSCSPFFACFQARAGIVTIQATGKGNYVLLANESGFC